MLGLEAFSGDQAIAAGETLIQVPDTSAVQQRCARWLLMTHDRMHEQDFSLSHEFLAVMLRVQRPTVSVTAATLQEAGFIRYTHGRITARDRKGLEAAACERYAIVRAHFDRLLT